MTMRVKSVSLMSGFSGCYKFVSEHSSIPEPQVSIRYLWYEVL